MTQKNIIHFKLILIQFFLLKPFSFMYILPLLPKAISLACTANNISKRITTIVSNMRKCYETFTCNTCLIIRHWSEMVLNIPCFFNKTLLGLHHYDLPTSYNFLLYPMLYVCIGKECVCVYCYIYHITYWILYKHRIYLSFYLSISTQLIALQEITIAFPHIKLKPMHPSTDILFLTHLVYLF